MKTAWVLSGGGAKGSFQVGVMKRLVENGHRPDIIYGTSVGALNSCGMAFGDIAVVEKIWLDIKDRNDILSLNWWKLPWCSGVYSMAPLKKIIDKVTSNSRSGIESVVCYVNLSNSKIHYASSSQASLQDYRKSVLASSSIPFVMEPVDEVLVDGGVREQTPLKKAIQDGADKIVSILCNPLQEDLSGKWEPSFPKFVSSGIRALDVMEHEVFINDVKKCIEYNKRPDKKVIDIEVYCPSKQVIDTLDFNPSKIRAAIAMGYSSDQARIS